MTSIGASLDAEFGDSALWWLARPSLEDVRLWRAPRRASRLARRLPRRRRLPLVVRRGHVAVAATTANQWAAVRSVVGPAQGFGDGGTLGMTTIPRSALPMVNRGEEALRDLGMGDMATHWRRACALGATAEQHFHRLAPEGIRVLLIASAQDPAIRGLLRAARARGIATVSVPHAPVTRKAHYLDFPVDAAGVRGAAELEFYGRYGIADDRLRVVGNPAVEMLGARPSALAAPPVLAVSPDPLPVLEHLFHVAAAAMPDDTVVCPHPRSDIAELRRLAPRSWHIAERGSTARVLARGPRYVVQQSSGVALEAAMLGIPTADIRTDGTAADYPFLDDPALCTPIADAAALSEFVKGVGAAARPTNETVLRWCAADGEQAAGAVTAMVEEAAAAGPTPRVIHDGWARGGAALAHSTVWSDGTAAMPHHDEGGPR